MKEKITVFWYGTWFAILLFQTLWILRVNASLVFTGRRKYRFLKASDRKLFWLLCIVNLQEDVSMITRCNESELETTYKKNSLVKEENSENSCPSTVNIYKVFCLVLPPTPFKPQPIAVSSCNREVKINGFFDSAEHIVERTDRLIMKAKYLIFGFAFLIFLIYEMVHFGHYLLSTWR